MVASIRQRLSYNLLRLLYRIEHPDNYRKLIDMRSNISDNKNLPTFVPFIDTKCLFVHIPKVAGISIGSSLFGRYTGNHTTIREYKIAFSMYEFNEYFKFAFVRNPWDRLLSAYLYLKDGGRNKWDYKWASVHLSEFTTFKDFVMEWVSKNNINTGIHFMPQYKYLTSTNSNIPEVDFIGYFENINNDYEYIRSKLGFGKKLIFSNKTQNKTRDYRVYYNDDMIEVVSKTYDLDIKLFGYNFENTNLDRQSLKRTN